MGLTLTLTLSLALSLTRYYEYLRWAPAITRHADALQALTPTRTRTLSPYNPNPNPNPNPDPDQATLFNGSEYAAAHIRMADAHWERTDCNHTINGVHPPSSPHTDLPSPCPRPGTRPGPTDPPQAAPEPNRPSRPRPLTRPLTLTLTLTPTPTLPLTLPLTLGAAGVRVPSVSCGDGQNVINYTSLAQEMWHVLRQAREM